MSRLFGTFVAAFLCLGSGGAMAQAQIELTDVWARSSAGMTRAGAVYLGIANKGSEADRLLSASSPAAARVELHETVKDGEIMRMRPVPSIPVGPRETVALKPGGMHIMLLDLVQPIKQGDRISLVLTFEKSGKKTVDVPVNAAGAMGSGHPAPMHDMKGK